VRSKSGSLSCLRGERGPAYGRRVCTQAHPGLLSALTSAPRLSSPPPAARAALLSSLLCSARGARGASRRVACERARRVPGPRMRASPRRGDRDAKETRAAFKLAAAKRINSPGPLDLLIRAAVAFLRGLDR